jgi:hypothetical protein
MSVFQKVRGTTADRFAVGIGKTGDKYLEADTGAASLPFVRYNDTTKRWEFTNDGTTIIDLASGGGITPTAHKALYDLIHFIDDGPAEGFVSGAYKETLPAGDPFPTSETWWTSGAKTRLLVALTISRNPNKTPATEVWEMYDATGNKIVTVTDTIAYQAVFETARTRTWTMP